MTQLTELNKISIAEVVFYSPVLLIGIFLSMRHGFGRSAGWLYLILFSLIRLIGASMNLATISDPTNVNLLVGSSTLENIGLSPLILIGVGLVTRIRQGISQMHQVLLDARVLRFIQLFVIVGLILGIVGGSDLGGTIGNLEANHQSLSGVSIPVESQAGVGLMIAGYALLVIATAMLSTQFNHIQDGERRLMLAVITSLPFILVRLIYSAMSDYTDNPNFRQFDNAPQFANYMLGMAVIMEMIVVAIMEGVGMSLNPPRKTQPVESRSVEMNKFSARV